MSAASIALISCLFVQPSIGATEGLDFFEKKIRPVLVRHCYECHSVLTEEPKGGYLLDSRERLRRGGDSGPAVVPGNVDESPLIEALRYESFEMPPENQLPAEVILDFVKWVEMGAPDPRDRPPDPKTLAEFQWETIYEERRGWWSLQSVVEPPVPEVEAEGQYGNWSDQPIDRFILTALQEKGLGPAVEADRTTLGRRLTFALTGLPPNSVDVDESPADVSPAAWKVLVDRVLDSPHFGEHWARHWMDVVRYTDTYGYEWDMPAKGAWRYRDYLTRAFNDDVPFNQLVREQIAGDLLETPRTDPAEHINESIIGSMFYQMGENRHGDSAEFIGIHQEMIDNKIDAFSKAFQALTVSCARCHDHKLDPISQREYYALAGVFMSSRWMTNTADLPERNSSVLEKLKRLKIELRPLIATLWLEDAKTYAADMVRGVDAIAETADRASAGNAVGEGRDVWQSLLETRLKSEPALEDPLHAWLKIIAAARAGDPISATWKQLAARYRGERLKRVKENAANFNFIVDFRDGVPEGWAVDGVGLRDLVRSGDFTVALDGDAAIGRLLPGGLFTDALSPRLNGVVRSPMLRNFKSGHISFEHAGGDFAAHRTVVDNAFLTERQRYLTNEDPSWVLLGTKVDDEDRHIYIEFATKTSNPNFPPRVGLGGKCSDEQAADPKSWFGLTRVALHEAPSTPQDELKRFTTLFEGEAPESLAEVARRYELWFRTALKAWAGDRAAEDDVWLINWLRKSGLLSNKASDERQPQIRELVARYRNVEQRIALPWTVNGMADVDPGYNYRLNIRGEYTQLGDAVPRGYLRVLTGSRAELKVPESGRRQLAEFVADPKNPLTARVFVNRVWHWLFGTGLVATPSNFGHLGDRPSHPALLDYLASQFMKENWSLKELVRSIVLTKTWRQSGQTTDLARDVDPDNRLLHHYPLRRLGAEAIRDSMLVTSGRLDRTLYGPPINPHREKEDSQKRLYSGPLDGDGRRSIYTKITIMEPPRFLATFNQPEPKIPTGKRDVTNTVAQSLALLNSPFVSGEAERWARRLIESGDVGRVARLTRMFRRAFGRPPADREVDRWQAAIRDFATAHDVADSDVMTSVVVWKDVAHAMYNMKEFIYVH